jgi:hypothetical protein
MILRSEFLGRRKIIVDPVVLVQGLHNRNQFGVPATHPTGASKISMHGRIAESRFQLVELGA